MEIGREERRAGLTDAMKNRTRETLWMCTYTQATRPFFFYSWTDSPCSLKCVLQKPSGCACDNVAGYKRAFSGCWCFGHPLGFPYS